MEVCSYASDLTDAEWALLEPLIARSHPAGRRQIDPLRRIVNAILCLLRSGAEGRMLPHEYPPRCERLVETGEMLLYLAMSRILLRRLTRKER